jgi:hypothetical protein
MGDSQDAAPDGENLSTAENTANVQEEAPAATEAQMSAPAHTAFLRLRGLPFQAGMQDVEAFFNSPGKQIPLRSVLICKRNGKIWRSRGGQKHWQAEPSDDTFPHGHVLQAEALERPMLSWSRQTLRQLP